MLFLFFMFLKEYFATLFRGFSLLSSLTPLVALPISIPSLRSVGRSYEFLRASLIFSCVVPITIWSLSCWQLNLPCSAALCTRLQNAGSDSWVSVPMIEIDDVWARDSQWAYNNFASFVRNISSRLWFARIRLALPLSSRRRVVWRRICREVLPHRLSSAILLECCRIERQSAPHRHARVSNVERNVWWIRVLNYVIVIRLDLLFVRKYLWQMFILVAKCILVSCFE